MDDILSAFVALESLDKLPSIYCKATELLNLPTLSLDPVSEQLRDSCTSLASKLELSIQELKEHLSSTRASLSKDLATINTMSYQYCQAAQKALILVLLT